MMKRQHSSLDIQQMQRYSYSEENEAMRVEVVGGGDVTVNVDTEALVGAVKEGLSGLSNDKVEELLQKALDQGLFTKSEVEKPLATMTPSFQTIEIPTVIKETEIKIVEVPVIVKETVIKEINVPVVVEHIKTVTIEKPVITTEYKSISIELPKSINILLVLNTLAILGLVINLFMRGK